MRLRELLEGTSKFHSDHTSCMTRHKTYDKLSSNYDLYRFGITMAGSPDSSHEKTSIGEVPTIFAYSDGDQHIIDSAEKKHGIRGKKMTDSSHEPDHVNKNSPVAKIKRNQYGV